MKKVLRDIHGNLGQIAANLGSISATLRKPHLAPTRYRTVAVIVDHQRWISTIEVAGGRAGTALKGEHSMTLELFMETMTVEVLLHGARHFHPILALDRWFNIPIHIYKPYVQHHIAVRIY